MTSKIQRNVKILCSISSDVNQKAIIPLIVFLYCIVPNKVHEVFLDFETVSKSEVSILKMKFDVLI